MAFCVFQSHRNWKRSRERRQVPRARTQHTTTSSETTHASKPTPRTPVSSAFPPHLTGPEHRPTAICATHTLIHIQNTLENKPVNLMALYTTQPKNRTEPNPRSPKRCPTALRRFPPTPRTHMVRLHSGTSVHLGPVPKLAREPTFRTPEPFSARAVREPQPARVVAFQPFTAPISRILRHPEVLQALYLRGMRGVFTDPRGALNAAVIGPKMVREVVRGAGPNVHSPPRFATGGVQERHSVISRECFAGEGVHLFIGSEFPH